jgi:hypothetical protein
MFQIGLHKKDKARGVPPEKIQSYFGVGGIYKQGLESIKYVVGSRNDLEVIINHFYNYPLITQKLADFLLFKQGYEIIKTNKHLTTEGLEKLVAIKASMNLGLSNELKAAFPNLTPVPRPVVKDQEIKNRDWLAGFTC